MLIMRFCLLWMVQLGLVLCPVTISQRPEASAADAELKVKNYRDLQGLAEQRAAADYVPESPPPAVLSDLNYDQYRNIQFRHEDGIWSDGQHPFWLEFFHRGFVQRNRVDVYLIESNQLTGSSPAGNPSATIQHEAKQAAAVVREVDYQTDLFRFDGPVADLEVPGDVGFAGLRVAGRFQPGGDPQELLAFIGSSYFRSRSADTVYGTSVRGLAVNIGLNQDEEFPVFRSFWVEEPQVDEKQVTVLALLESPTVSGAYEFILQPGPQVSEVDVRATLYFRQQPEKLGLAPLTSMWIWGDGLHGPPRDQRPSVHDADGLLIHADETWSWRALARLPYPSVTSTAVKDIKGFGLLQRDRDFAHYEDYNARYHDRPSVWVEPTEPFGEGRVELLEIPGAHEGVDNIAAYFVPAVPVDIHQPMRLHYRLSFFRDESALGGLVTPRSDSGSAAQTDRRLATCRGLDVRRGDKLITLVIDFQTHSSVRTHAPEDVVPSSELIRGVLRQQSLVKTADGYVVTLAIEPTEDAPIEIELTLRGAQGGRLSETFRYLCPRTQPTFVYPAVYTRQE